MKYGIAADLHARGKDLDSFEKQLRAMINICGAQDVDALIFPGDIFHCANIADQFASTGAIAKVVIGILSIFGRDIFVIPGNHDCAGAGSEHALHCFDGMSNVTTLKAGPHVHFNSERADERVVIYALPWAWKGSAEATVEKMGISNREIRPSIFIAHVQITGAHMSAHKICDQGDGVWQLPRKILEQLPVDHIALGDFHKRQDLSGGRGGYVGALRQLTFGEAYNPTGFEIWDTSNNSVQWIELKEAPRYKVIELSAEIFNKTEIQDEFFERGHYCRVKVIGGKPDPAVVARMETQGAEVQHITEAQERVRRAEVKPGILDDDHALILLYAENQDPPIEGDRLKAMLDTYDEVIADKRQTDRRPETAVAAATVSAGASNPGEATAPPTPDCLVEKQRQVREFSLDQNSIRSDCLVEKDGRVE